MGTPRLCGDLRPRPITLDPTLLTDPETPDPTPWADRRLADRHPPRPGTRVEVRRGVLGQGPDVVIDLLDLTVSGAKIRIRGHLRRADRVAVKLIPPTGAWVADGTAVVHWCLLGADGTLLAGIQFRRPLAICDLTALVAGLG
jgi:hypothetical protein